jgi:hypothetical protein
VTRGMGQGDRFTMGRPKLDIDGVEVGKLARMGASNVDIADFFGCDEGTIRRRFSEILTKGRAERKIALRVWQWKAAEAGNVAMLIWLGKQELGQADRVEAKHEVGPIVDRHAQVDMLSNPRAVQLACDLDAEMGRPGVRRNGHHGQADPSQGGQLSSTQGEPTNRGDDPSSPERDGG